ncbi:MAG: SDR family NAD(P)-dependent oxidoreductase [Actinomycetota bacterium]|nr:SDR family NAD(P)-dependent oxidoreductase [Actinomycetota bacterium]
MKDLKGKVVLITGAARGMGKLEAIDFAREGAKVVLADIDQAELETTAGEIKDMSLEAYSYVHDVSDHNACFTLAEKVELEVGPVDVLINNAAVALNEPVLNTTEGEFKRITEVNYLGQVWMIQAFVPGMVKRGRGHVVNICSIAGKVAVPYMGAYCATKHAMVGLSDTLRLELASTGVKVSIVNPGYIATGMFKGSKVPLLTSWQEPQKVADGVMGAVKKNQAEIFVPAVITRITAFSRGLGLPKPLDFIFKIMGVHKTFTTMKKERGRPF